MPQTVRKLLEEKDAQLVCDDERCALFLEREEKGGVTRDEDPESHICVYFAPYDPQAKEVFIGMHIKARTWLFNGGHVDKDETVDQTLPREMKEEWGMVIKTPSKPHLLTTTDIDNPGVQTCRKHFDVWYFIPVKKETFSPNKELLAKEFTNMQWMSIEEAYNNITDPATRKALDRITSLL